MREGSASVFIKIDEYKDIIEIMNTIKHKIGEGKQTLEKINELKNKEDEEFEIWMNNLYDVEKKVALVDESLFEPER